MPMPPPVPGHENAVKPAKSKGEKLFDKITYVGIAGIGTFHTTVVLTDELKFGKLKWIHEGVAKGIEGAANFIAPRGDHKQLAEDAAMTTSLMMGGNLMLLPIGYAEQHKVQFVDGLNAAMDDKTPKEAIEKAPKQTWMSLLKSRCLAWAAVFTTFKVLGHYYGATMKSFESQTGDLLCHIMGNRPTHRMETVVKDGIETLERVETKTYRYGNIGALDMFATIGAATLLYLGGHFFARKQELKKELREERMHETKTAHEGEPELREQVPENVPSSSISGQKQHEGNAGELAIAQQR